MDWLPSPERDTSSAPTSARTPAPSPTPRRIRWLYPLLACSVLTLGNALAFRTELAGSPLFWMFLSAPTLAQATYAALVQSSRARLRQLLTPRAGDLTLGAVVGAIMLALSWAIRDVLQNSGGTAQAWLELLFAQLGDPRDVQESASLTVLIIAVAFGEEILHRGWIQDHMNALLGRSRGWIASGVLFACTLSPTILTLRSAEAPNPLLFVAALGCGLCFGLCRKLTDRLTPGFVAHAVFTYFTVAQFRSPGL